MIRTHTRTHTHTHTRTHARTHSLAFPFAALFCLPGAQVVEIAPAPSLPEDVRTKLCTDAVNLGRSIQYRNAGTVEFLVDTSNGQCVQSRSRTHTSEWKSEQTSE